MIRLRVAAAAAVFAISASGGADAAPSIKVDGDCRTVRLKADGSRVVTPARGKGTGAVAITVRDGGSVSTTRSAASDGGRSVSTSTVNGITVTVTRDETGCTAVIDERSSKRNPP